MYTRADGSCAKGAILLAIATPADSEYLPEDILSLSALSSTHPAPLVHSPDNVASFGHHIANTIAEWSPEQWYENISPELRDDAWEGWPRCLKEDVRCSQGNCVCRHADRTPELELELFRSAMRRSTSHQGPTFFIVAAHVIQKGILLITDDGRLRSQGTVRHVHDYGSSDYSSCIVIYSAIHAASSTGHYETVGVFPLRVGPTSGLQEVDTAAAEPATIFERNHWLPTHLRAAAARYSEELTLDASRIYSHRHAAVPSTQSLNVEDQQLQLDPAPGEPSDAPNLDYAIPCAPSMSQPDLRAQPIDDDTPCLTSTRPRRKLQRPARYAAEEDASSIAIRPSRTPTARCSLQQQFDAAATSPAAATKAAPPAARSRRATRARSRGASSTDCASSPMEDGTLISPNSPSITNPAPAAAAPRHPQSSGVDILGARVLANAQTWIRNNTTVRGRMPLRVHSSAVPSWTNQARAALQHLATALQRSPMNEAEVVGRACTLWLLPAAVFGMPGRPRGGQRGRRSRQNRMHHALRDRELNASLFASVMQDGVQHEDVAMSLDWTDVDADSDDNNWHEVQSAYCQL